MFEQMLSDNPLLSVIIIFLIFSVIIFLIRWGIQIIKLSVDSATKTPLIKAAQAGNIKECSRLLDTGEDINQKTKMGNTPLIVACLHGKAEIVKFLISKGASVNQLGEDNQTPLMNAIFYDSESTNEIVDFLVREGADINMIDKRDGTALGYSILYDNLYVFNLLIENGANIDPSAIVTAVKNNNTQMALKLIELGADVNLFIAGSKKSLLRMAVEAENEELVEILLQKGADVNSRDISGVSILDYGTIFTYRNKVIKKLLKEAKEKNKQ